MPDKPLLLIDVDGVISLFGFPSNERPPGSWVLVDGTPHFLSAEAGAHLQALADPFELAWCTGWEEKANDYLPSALGLPGPLPHLQFDGRPGGPGSRAHWKLAAIDDHAGPERPLAWIDDTLNDACHAWARERPGPTLLVETRARDGLLRGHVDELIAWAAGGPAHPCEGRLGHGFPVPGAVEAPDAR